jgi:hypothetical protein
MAGCRKDTQIRVDGLALAGAGEAGRAAKLDETVRDPGCTRQKGRAR